MLAAFTTNLFNSSFSGFHYSGSFGLLRESNILFKSTLDILNNITIFLPTGGGLYKATECQILFVYEEQFEFKYKINVKRRGRQVVVSHVQWW